jgi:LysM repeat protein
MRLRTVLSLATAGVLATAAPAAADFAHVVAPGETLTSVAAADGLTVGQLAAANGISPFTQIVAGTTLMIPPQSGSTGVTNYVSSTVTDADGDSDGDTASPSGSAGGGSYVVQPGDTLSAIAARAGVSVDSLAAANGLDPNGVLLSGSVISLTGSSTGSGVASAVSSQPIGASAQGTAGGPPYPTPERLTASQVGSIANANGVPPAFADAIGWQESGFNNDLVSSAGAVGVMQILPGTWDWINRTLNAGTALDPASATDNVRAGAEMLHSLLAATGGDTSMAAAGYYQGLASVQQNGMFADTRQYVNDVASLMSQFGGG